MTIASPAVRTTRRHPREAGVRPLATAAAVLTGLTYALIVLGALVRAHGAGLACPDWPLCFGQVVPAFDMRVAFEYGHRVVAGSVALGFVALSVAILRRRPLRSGLLPLLGLGAGLLALQILLGALTVWHLLASWTVTAHLLTGNAFAATLLLTAVALHDRARGRSVDATPPAGTVTALTGLAAVLVAGQMTLGGLVSSRFVGLACPEWPTCLDGVFIPSLDGAVGLQVMHRMNAYALWVVLGAAALRARGLPGLGSRLAAAFAVATLQIGVGVANVLLRIPVEITGLHSALAATLVALVVLCVRDLWLRRATAGATTAPAQGGPR